MHVTKWGSNIEKIWYIFKDLVPYSRDDGVVVVDDCDSLFLKWTRCGGRRVILDTSSDMARPCFPTDSLGTSSSVPHIVSEVTLLVTHNTVH